MVDDLEKRLEAQGSSPVAPIDRTFKNRLESKLRVDHSELSPRRRTLAAVLARWGLPRLGIAAAAVAFGAVAIVALTSGSAGIPLDVIDGKSPPPADQPDGLDGGDGEQAPVGGPTATAVVGVSPTATATAVAAPDASIDDDAADDALPQVSTTPAPEPTPTRAAAATDAVPTATVSSLPPAEPVPTVDPLPSPTSAPPVRPTPTAAPPAPTATPQPPRPLPAPTATPTAPRPESSPTPSPTSQPVVGTVDLNCEVRAADRGVGVVCAWSVPDSAVSITSFTVLRSRNDAAATVVSRQRATAGTTYVDRDLTLGDQATYLVRAVGADDVLLGESVRVTVQIPASD